MRICRPGSIIGHQQEWLEDKQTEMWREVRIQPSTLETHWLLAKYEYIWPLSTPLEKKLAWCETWPFTPGLDTIGRLFRGVAKNGSICPHDICGFEKPAAAVVWRLAHLRSEERELVMSVGLCGLMPNQCPSSRPTRPDVYYSICLLLLNNPQSGVSHICCRQSARGRRRPLIQFVFAQNALG